MRKMLASPMAFFLFSGFALASPQAYGAPNVAVVTQMAGDINGAFALQQAQIGQNTGRHTNNAAQIGQYIFGASQGSLVYQSATINQISILPLSSFSGGN